MRRTIAIRRCCERAREWSRCALDGELSEFEQRAARRAPRPLRRLRRVRRATSARRPARSAPSRSSGSRRPIVDPGRRAPARRASARARLAAAAAVVAIAGAARRVMHSLGRLAAAAAHATGPADRRGCTPTCSSSDRVPPTSSSSSHVDAAAPRGLPAGPQLPSFVTGRGARAAAPLAQACLALLVSSYCLKPRPRRPCGGVAQERSALPLAGVDRARRSGRLARARRRLRALAPRPSEHPVFRRRMPSEQNGQNVGKVVEIKGVVHRRRLPGRAARDLQRAADQRPERGRRPAIELVAEVQQHLGDDRVRAVAMDSTDGLAARRRRRRHRRADLGAGRRRRRSAALWNVLGEPIDDKRRDARGRRALADPPRPAGVPRPVAEDRDLRDRASR